MKNQEEETKPKNWWEQEELKSIKKEKIIKDPWLRKALFKPFNMLIFALALGGLVTASISLIIGSVAVHKTDKLNYFLNEYGEAVWGNSTIWVSMYNYPDIFSLYFSFKKNSSIDIKWDGNYPDNYFKK